MEKFIFEYIDVELIDEELKCAVCYRPFHCPLSNSQCGHTFCEECLITWYKNSSNCPSCRQESNFEAYQPVTSRVVLNQLARLNLKCNLCEQTNIIDRKSHIQICPKQTIKCTSADLQCQWEGERQALSEHLETCPLQRIRPIFDRLIHAIEMLKEAQDRQNHFIQAFLNGGHILSNHCPSSSCLRTNPIVKMPCSVCKMDIPFRQFTLHSCTTMNCICERCLSTYSIQQLQSSQVNLKRKLFSVSGDDDDDDDNEQFRNR